MGMLVWVMMALAIWHFTVYLPDRFWGGIAGAFVGALAGGILIPLIISGFSIPGQSDTDLGTLLEAIPGALIGIGAIYAIGVREERKGGGGATGTTGFQPRHRPAAEGPVPPEA